jgi:N6-adenosine-specific RNA methylase IME4/ParB-like chromosome segregation protein Spo0J
MMQSVALALSPAEMEARIAALEAQLASLEICETCGGLPGVNPNFCEACGRADRKGAARHHLERLRRLLADDVSLEHAWHERQPKGTAALTVEALMYSLRRGVNELTRPDTQRRLSTVSNVEALSRDEIRRRIGLAPADNQSSPPEWGTPKELPAKLPQVDDFSLEFLPLLVRLGEPVRQEGVMNYKFHPLADVLPLIEGAEFDRLVADIAKNGLLNAITVHDDMILDGRNRERACRAAGVEPVYAPFTDPAAFVLSQNLARRHLGPSERAMVAARLANLKWGQRADRVEGSIDLSTAAQLADVSEPSVKRAKIVIERGTPALQEAVDRGRIAVHEAAKAAKESPEAQTDFLAAAAAGKTFQAWSTNYGRKVRAEELAATTKAMPIGERRWPVILADPPWDFEVWALEKQTSHPTHHYPVMSLAEVCALPVAELAADDSVLFLWTTVPLLEKTFEVIRAWGFEYKSGLAWDKEIPGLGYWVRGQHELLLIATRGNPPLPSTQNVPASVIRERRREHSRKPEASYVVIEGMFPDLPKLELFARQCRPGWDVWGNETEKFGEAEAAS